jgi:hypothetical protein
MSGITNRQAKYLASLQREAGERYSGSGMSAFQASTEIRRLRQERDQARAQALSRPRHGGHGQVAGDGAQLGRSLP